MGVELGLGEMLKNFGTDLTELAQAGKLDPVIGREEEIRRTLQMYSLVHVIIALIPPL